MSSNRTRNAILVLIIILIVVAGAAVVLGAGNGSGIICNEEKTPVFVINGYTNITEVRVTPESGTAESLEGIYGPLNIPETIRCYDIAKFNVPELLSDGRNTLGVTIRGNGYNMILEKMGFEEIDDGIGSYSGSFEGDENSLALLTFTDDNIVQGSVTFGDEMFFITAVQNRENAMKTKMPLHIIYSSKDVSGPYA